MPTIIATIITVHLFAPPLSAPDEDPNKYVAQLTRDEIRDELEDLEKKITKLEEKIERSPDVVDAAKALKKHQEALAELDKAVPIVETATNELATLKCDAKELQLPTEKLQAASDALRALPFPLSVTVSVPWDSDLLTLATDAKRPSADRKRACEQLVASRIMVFNDAVKDARAEVQEVQDELTSNEEKLRTNTSELTAVKLRRDTLRKALSTATAPRETIGGDLKLIIAILGLFSLLIMVVVRRFALEVQKEWVASGQVIQFMTVTIIISAVLALGLSKTLTPEILGTLLGSIGGYVLSQGIGRSTSNKIDKVESRVEEFLRGSSKSGSETRLEEILKRLVQQQIAVQSPLPPITGPGTPPAPQEPEAPSAPPPPPTPDPPPAPQGPAAPPAAPLFSTPGRPPSSGTPAQEDKK